MAKRKAPAEMPAYLEEFLAGLEAQALAGEKLDRVAILQSVEQKHQRIIDIDAELAEHPEAQERFQRVWRRVTMGLEDAAINSARSGHGSATTILRGMGAVTRSGSGSGGSRAANGRLQLDRSHKTKVDGHRSGW